MIKFLSFVLTGFLLCQDIHQVSTFIQSEIGLKSNWFLFFLTLLTLFCLFLNLVAEPIAPPPPTKECPNDLAATCDVRCQNGDYVLDTKGCPTCACTSNASVQRVGRPPIKCPLYKCRANCGLGGYVVDEKGCQTCKCTSTSTKDVLPKPSVDCVAHPMCRMFCEHGFRSDENGCEICQCNDSPRACPVKICQNTCLHGYRKDYSGKDN
jgi:hypothetical protein